ncbi:MAG: hypothetical protein QW254_03100, partial [Desulfurococcaceae archaeon]
MVEVEKNALNLPVNIIEIPLKPRKRMISLRINEDDLAVIDRFVASSCTVSRTLLLTRLIEAFAEGLRRANGDVSKVYLVFKSSSSSKEI